MKHVLRSGLMALALVVGSMTSATAQVSVGIWLPGVSIGINVPVYPQLVAVPGYPVYYAPQMNSNYFFYDGMYWVYQSDNWYASSWYNGPWGRIGPEAVPVFLLRVPVQYYRAPPPYFRGWQADRPPRWDQHWGNEWNQRRRGWDQWDQRSVPQRAPLPTYQRQYSGNKYPPVERQAALQGQQYKYQPRDVEVRQHYESQRQQQQQWQQQQQQQQQRQQQQQDQQQAYERQQRQQQAYERQQQQQQQQQQQKEYQRQQQQQLENQRQQQQQQRQQQEYQRQQQQRQQQPAPRPPEEDRGSQGKGSQDRGSQGKGSGYSSGQGQPGSGDQKK